MSARTNINGRQRRIHECKLHRKISEQDARVCEKGIELLHLLFVIISVSFVVHSVCSATLLGICHESCYGNMWVI